MPRMCYQSKWSFLPTAPERSLRLPVPSSNQLPGLDLTVNSRNWYVLVALISSVLKLSMPLPSRVRQCGTCTVRSGGWGSLFPMGWEAGSAILELCPSSCAAVDARQLLGVHAGRVGAPCQGCMWCLLGAHWCYHVWVVVWGRRLGDRTFRLLSWQSVSPCLATLRGCREVKKEIAWILDIALLT